MPRHDVKEIVQLDRGVRVCGGKMRPYERPIWVCKLSCGHTIEKLKSTNQGLPQRSKCPLCPVELDVQA